jgi:hypothetical protein
MVIAQQDSKINVKIARAAKRDSSSMTAIAVLGFIFLPAMLVAVSVQSHSEIPILYLLTDPSSRKSIFSMSMFDFSPNSSGENASTGGHSYVSHKFWMYWVVTIPLTFAVLMAWWAWMRFHSGTPGDDGESLKQERILAVQSRHEANLALNTPFYPVKGIRPGHMF